MKCPRCDVEMKIGIGINPSLPDWALRSFVDPPEGPIDHTQLRLDQVWKCPRCGHSKDIQPKVTK